MKKCLTWISVVVFCLTVCFSALASTGDRTLLRIDHKEGYMDQYVTQVLRTGEGILVMLDGKELGARLYTDLSGEPEEFKRPADETPTEIDEDSQIYTQTVGYFAWNGEVYALQFKMIYSGETSDVEGGFIKRVVLQDGVMTLEDCDLPQLDWEDMIEDYGTWRSSRTMNGMMVIGDWLLGTSYDMNGQMQLIRFDLTTGEMEELELPEELSGVYVGPDDSLLLSQYEWGEETKIHLLRFSLTDEDQEEIATIPLGDGMFQGVCYDPVNDFLYYIQNGEIWRAPEMNLEQAEIVNDCPLTYDVNCMLLQDGFLLLWAQDTLVIRNTDPAARGGFTLTVQDYGYATALSDTIFDFTDARGDASVVMRQGGDPSDILQAMMNRDAQIDIYSLDYQSSQFDALRTRGFLADLGDNEALRVATERMYSFVRDAIWQDGKLVAVPFSLGGYGLGIHRKVWEKLGGTDEELPKTWNQFFDWLETLPGKIEGQECCIMDRWMTREGFRGTILTSVINQYQVYLEQTGEDYAFNTPLLRGVLDRLASLDYDALGLRENTEEEDSESYEYMEPLLEVYTSMLISSWEGNAEPLPLSFAEEAPALPVTATVAFVNPYSEHQEAAKEYLALALNNLRSDMEYALFSDRTEPIRDPYYEENLEMLQKWLDDAKAQLEKADEDERAMWEENVNNYESYIKDAENNSWMIGPTAIAAYQNRVDMLKLLSYDFAAGMVSEDGTSGYWEMVEAFSQGQITAENLLSGIDKKVQMMRLEGN